MKTMRSGHRRFRLSARQPGRPAFVLGQLLELPHHHVALQLGNVVDEQHAVEVVDLVLQAGREQAVGLELLRLAVRDRDSRPSPRRALDLGVIVGDRQAAFLVDRARRRRVATISGLMKTCGAGSSPSLARSITSRRSGSPTWMAASPMPGASYIVSSMSSSEVADVVVDALDRLGDLAQQGIGKNDERLDRHGDASPKCWLGERQRPRSACSRFDLTRRGELAMLAAWTHLLPCSRNLCCGSAPPPSPLGAWFG